jgi:hypothetical protein
VRLRSRARAAEPDEEGQQQERQHAARDGEEPPRHVVEVALFAAFEVTVAGPASIEGVTTAT